MKDERLLCIGTGNRLTSPWPATRENSRSYEYPAPGTIHVHGGEATTGEISLLPKHKLVAAYQGGPVIQGFGLLVIGDTYSKVIKPMPEQPGMILLAAEWEMKLVKALDRARDLLSFWAATFPSWNYGVIRIEGEFPTEEELSTAREARKTSALIHLNQEITNQKLASEGRREAAPGFTPGYRAWALEYGVLLPTTVDSMVRVQSGPVEDVQCPECMLLCAAQARKCRHCGTNFKMPLMEFLTRPEPAITGSR